MSNTQEPELTPNVEGLEADSRFVPRWTGCTGLFNEADGGNRRENEEVHYRKHAVIGREWEAQISISEYRSLATRHLNSVDADHVIELCQTEDLAVVKYNLESGELGIARGDDGTIKTFFRPRDVAYVLRKVDAGAWGEPALADGFETSELSLAISDDAHIAYLFARFEHLAIELPAHAHLVVAGFAEGSSVASEMLSMLARLGEYRFCVFELQRRVLTEAQAEILFARRKKIVGATASFEALERYRARELTEAIAADLETSIAAQELLWRDAATLIGNGDEFEDALDRRQILGYALLELRVLQLHRRLLELDIQAYEYRVSKSDIHLRSVFYQLAVSFSYQETHLVSPEAFFWRRMGKNIS
jgi:hypothetical protein